MEGLIQQVPFMIVLHEILSLMNLIQDQLMVHLYNRMFAKKNVEIEDIFIKTDVTMVTGIIGMVAIDSVMSNQVGFV